MLCGILFLTRERGKENSTYPNKRNSSLSKKKFFNSIPVNGWKRNS